MCGKGRSTESWKTHLGGATEVARQEEVWKSAPGQLRSACASGNGTFKRKREEKEETLFSGKYTQSYYPDVSANILRKPARTYIWHFKVLITNPGPVIYFDSCSYVAYDLRSRIIFSNALARLGWAITKCSIRRTSSSEVSSGLYCIRVLENCGGQPRNLSAYCIHIILSCYRYYYVILRIFM